MTDDVATPQAAMEKRVVNDRLASSANATLPLARGWTPRRLRVVSSGFCQALDLISLGGAFLALVIMPFWGRARATPRFSTCCS